MVRLTAALISALNDGADLATIQTLSVPNRDFDQVAGLDVCERLTRLDISGNQITNLESLSMCTSLKWLSVAGNKLTSLKGVETLSKLTVLNGSRNTISSVSEVSSLVNLRALILNNNEITKVGRLDGLTNLNTLVLSHNPIRELGNSTTKLLSITKLSVSHCRIQILGSSLKRCVALEELRLAHNQLSELPKDIERNGRLRILDLGSNNLQSMTSLQVLGTLHNLSNLNLHGSPICSAAEYENEVKRLIPTLQILDGHPLQPGRIKRTNGRKTKFTRPTDGLDVETTIDTAMLKTKSSQAATTKDGEATKKGSRVVKLLDGADAPEQPFAVLITNQAKENKLSLDSGVVGVLDGERAQGGGYKRRRGSAALSGLGSLEIGTGGPSTWDNPTSTWEAPTHISPPKSYSRWQLKNY